MNNIEEIIDFMKWQNKHAEKSIKWQIHKTAYEYKKHYTPKMIQGFMMMSNYQLII